VAQLVERLMTIILKDIYADLHAFQQLVIKLSSADAEYQSEVVEKLENCLSRIKQLASTVKKRNAP